MYSLPTIPIAKAIWRATTWELCVLRLFGWYMWLNSVKTFKILVAECEDLLVLWLPKTNLKCKFLPVWSGLPLSSVSLCPLCGGGVGESTLNFTQGASKAEATGEPPTFGGKPGLAIDFYVGRALAVWLPGCPPKLQLVWCFFFFSWETVHSTLWQIMEMDYCLDVLASSMCSSVDHQCPARGWSCS